MRYVSTPQGKRVREQKTGVSDGGRSVPAKPAAPGPEHPALRRANAAQIYLGQTLQSFAAPFGAARGWFDEKKAKLGKVGVGEQSSFRLAIYSQVRPDDQASFVPVWPEVIGAARAGQSTGGEHLEHFKKEK